MPRKNVSLIWVVGVGLAAVGAGCAQYPFLDRTVTAGDTADGNTPDPSPNVGGISDETELPFAENLIIARTFVDGTSVTTQTYDVGDLPRVGHNIDFNGDGIVDPVVGYGPLRQADDAQSVLQILLSDSANRGMIRSLTLDSKRDMRRLADVAVGDIDGDGKLDIAAGAAEAVWYYHHPSDAPTTTLRLWGNQDGDDPLKEMIDVSQFHLEGDALFAWVAARVPPGVDLTLYDIEIRIDYSDVEIADMDNDGDNDIVSSQNITIKLTPKPGTGAPPLVLYEGDVLVFLNPGGAVDGHGWTEISVGRHERQERLDRDAARGLLLYDINGDGLLDIVSAAQQDNNVSIAWFEHPGLPLDPDGLYAWTQWRIGSVRDAYGLDLADVTGDGLPDVVATGAAQRQVVLFVHPTEPFYNQRWEYDWDTYPIVTFENYAPRDVLLADINNDGVRDVVVGTDAGAIRYFTRPPNPVAKWEGYILHDFDPPGEIGLLGAADIDGDGDIDLVAVSDDETVLDDIGDRVSWIQNNLSTVGAIALDPNSN